MSSELASSVNNQAQTTFDWDEITVETRRLVQEDADLTSTIEDAMVRRFEVRVRLGCNLMLLQEEHSKFGQGDFTEELNKLGLNRTFAHRCIRVAKLSQNPLISSLKQEDIPTLPMERWNQLASPSTHPVVVEQVLSGEIEPTYQSIKEANERARQAEEQNKQLQADFDFYKQEVEKRLSEPQEQLVKLQTELEERTQQRDNLAQLRKELSEELDEQRDANEARHKQELYCYRINERVKKICEEWGRSTIQLLGQLPSPIESQVVTADNWTLIEHIIDMAQRTISTIKQVKSHKSTIFIDSEDEGQSSC